MKKILVITLVIIGLVMVFRYATLFLKYFFYQCPVNGPVAQDDFVIYSEPVDLVLYGEEIFSYADIASIQVLETIEYESNKYEIYQIDINNSYAKKNLLIFAATHGNEFAAAIAIHSVLNDVRMDKEYYADWNIRIISPINPVGLAHASRYNENGCDINRDFENFSTVGADIQKNAIERFRPDAVISLHEGPQDGFFVILDGPASGGLRETIISQLKTHDVNLAKKNFLGVPLSTHGIWHKKSFVYALQRLFSIYTLGRYAHENNLMTITTESPWMNKDIESRIIPHIIVIRAVVKAL